MGVVSLRSILGRIQEELKEKEEVREEVQRDMRKATRLSKRAILLIHQERFNDAKSSLEEADKLFVKLLNISKDHPELVYSGLVDAAFQEYAEARILLSLVKENRFVNPMEINVPPVSYVLGLADVIGELRRRVLDSIRKGDNETAEKCLQTMEHIYVELMSMDDAYLLVPGLRRKCDIARRIIETTRGDITMETRRSSLEQLLKKFLR